MVVASPQILSWLVRLVALSLGVKVIFFTTVSNAFIKTLKIKKKKNRQNAKVNINSAENAHFMLWPDQFKKIRQIKAWYYRIDLTNPLRSYNGLLEFWAVVFSTVTTVELLDDRKFHIIETYLREKLQSVSQAPQRPLVIEIGMCRFNGKYVVTQFYIAAVLL